MRFLQRPSTLRARFETHPLLSRRRDPPGDEFTNVVYATDVVWSIPGPPAMIKRSAVGRDGARTLLASPSSRGLGRGPFKAKTRVRIPVGTPHQVGPFRTHRVQIIPALRWLHAEAQVRLIQTTPTAIQLRTPRVRVRRPAGSSADWLTDNDHRLPESPGARRDRQGPFRFAEPHGQHWRALHSNRDAERHGCEK